MLIIQIKPLYVNKQYVFYFQFVTENEKKRGVVG